MAKSLMFTMLGGLGAVVGCAGSGDGRPDVKSTAPHLMALSTYGASLGTPVDVYIENPPSADARSIELVFDGTFVAASGKERRVSIAQPTVRTEKGAGALQWTSFGPFSNPFTPTDPDVGVFRGKVAVRVTKADGTTVTDDNPLPIEFEVKPSIIITELQPTTASCNAPALALIGQLSYKMKATTIGFNAKTIEYAFKTPEVTLSDDGSPAFALDASKAIMTKTTTVSHELSQPIDSLDGSEAFTLPAVPANVNSYDVIFALTARDEQGRTIHSGFAMTAHNPLEITYDGRYSLAQLYEPKPVGACTPGGQQGRSVQYDESTTETRSRSVTLSISQSLTKGEDNSWSTTDGQSLSKSKTTTDSYSQTHGTSNTIDVQTSGSSSHSVGYNWSNTDQHGYDVSAKGNLGVGIEGFGSIGGEVGGGYNQSWTSQSGHSTDDTTTSGWSRGTSNTTSDSTTTDHSTATTNTSDVNHSDTTGGSNSVTQGSNEGQDQNWSVSSATTIQRGFSGQVIANTYGVFYRQMARYTRRAFVLQYNKCGETDVVGDLVLQDYTWAPDLALGESCSPNLPRTNFPKAECFLPPCDTNQ